MRLLRLYQEVVHQTLFVELLREHVVPPLALMGAQLHQAVHEHAADLLFLLLVMAAAVGGGMLALFLFRRSGVGKGLPRPRRRNPAREGGSRQRQRKLATKRRSPGRRQQ